MYTTPHAPTGLRGERTYGLLKAALVRGDFPVGERLGEERLATEIGVSRTPVREALSRLQSEGFVERHPDGGFTPVLPDLHTIRELYEVRFALERWALVGPLTGAPAHDRNALLALHDDWSQMQGAGAADADASFVLLDEDFHVRLAAAAGNRALADQLHAVNERIRVVRVHDFYSVERVRRTISQHLGVLDALLAGSPATAERQLVEHFAESLAFVEERAAAAIGRMVQRWRR